MKRHFAVLAVVAALLSLPILIVTGCTEAADPTSSDSTDEATTASVIGRYADPTQVDLEQIVGLDLAGLSLAEKRLLEQQSFVAVARAPGESPSEFWQVYVQARQQGLPVLITADSLLNAYQGLFDHLRSHVEETTLFERLFALSNQLYAASADQFAAAIDPVAKEDARLNAAYFAVARALLEPNTPIPAEVSVETQFELALIQQAAGPDESPVLGYTIDYSRYEPTAPYSGSERLRRYFKAMKWYQEAGFPINPRSPDISSEQAVGLTRRAILVSSLLSGDIKEDWEAVYRPSGFLVGQTDDLTLTELQEAVAQVFTTTQLGPDDLTGTAQLQQVRELLNGLSAPKTTSTNPPVEAADSVEAPADSGSQPQRSFTVISPPYLPDDYVFEQLLWEQVGSWDDPRLFPLGLDLMSALGSDQAYKLATEVYEQQRYEGWESQMEEVGQELSGKDSTIWPESLHTGWLETLEVLLASPPVGVPEFMGSELWAQKNLNSALGGWTEIRHDTVAHKEPATAQIEPPEDDRAPAGYVEPYPDFFNRIADLAAQTKAILADYHLLDTESAEKLDEMVSLARTLAKIAERQLAGDTLTGEEVLLIQDYGHRLRDVTRMDADDEGLAIHTGQAWSPLITTVCTDQSYSPALALREATGYPVYLYVAFSYDGAVQLFVGASYSYYEFPAAAGEGLTDSGWTVRLDSGDEPPRPSWTESWTIER